MIGISSRSAGVLLLPKSETDEYSILDVVVGAKRDPIDAQYLYSAVQDWEQVEGADARALLEAATREYWLARTVSLLRLAVAGDLGEALERSVLEHVEETLASRVESEKAIDRLLVAPLANPRSPLALAESALSYGFAAVASVLNELADLQPLLRRLVDLWLGLPATVFSHFSESKEMIWMTMVEKGEIKQLLTAGTGRDFTAKWNLLAFQFATPQSRSGISALGKELAHRLFPGKEAEHMVSGSATEETELTAQDQVEPTAGALEMFERAKKQIDAIALAVSQGHDARAERFLRELIQEQTLSSGGENYAVKSLCNIAKQCADMFRTDFEEICLKEALRLYSHDPWTLIQYGDHLKRIGDYGAALEVFAQAEQSGESDVAKSSMADVYSQQGDYAKAICTYETIPDWTEKPEVRTAIADNLRRMGHMDESEAAYTQLIDLEQQGLAGFVGKTLRAQAGIAEIAKRRGQLEDALAIYERILRQRGMDDRDRVVYKLSLCNVLKLMERFDQAYSIVDQVIEEYPFAMAARFVRGSILGLIGQAAQGLEDLREIGGSRSWREWLRRYYRGLLLFKLRRYEDAKKNLVEELPKAIASGEDKAILCMAAALCFLRERETVRVDGILSTIPELHDCHAQYLSLVLKLHLATQKRDHAMMKHLMDQIATIQVVDERLAKAVLALRKRNFPLALTYETDALLKLAA